MKAETIPVKTISLFLKQLNQEHFTETDKTLVELLFPLYPDLEDEQDAVMARIAQGAEQMLGKGALSDGPPLEQVKSQIIVRRFGWDGVQRGKYFTLARDPSGNDDGTLKNEIFAYYRPSKSTMLFLWDSTLPEHCDFLLTQTGLTFENCLVIGFPLLHKDLVDQLQINHSVKKTQLGFLIELPISLKSEVVDNVIDLRDPEVASWFTAMFTERSFHLFKPPLESFDKLLPSILTQGLGGSTFTTKAGSELGKMGINGFIFPSSRSNPFVIIENGSLKDWSGWNYVDYRGSQVIDADFIIDDQLQWPEFIEYIPTGPAAWTLPRMPYKDCEIKF